jgi:hypothetical protein
LINPSLDASTFHSGASSDTKGGYHLMIAHTLSASEGSDPSRTRYSPLKYQRLLRGWSQQDVVDAIYERCVASGCPDVGIGVEHIRRWENGISKPRPIYRKHLCQLYGMNAAQLGFIEEMEVPA